MAGPGFHVAEILQALADSEVRYVAVGGFAVIMHGHLRTTVDLGLVLDLERDNCKTALDTLADVGLQPRLPVQMSDFAEAEVRKDWLENRNMQVFQLWDPDNPVRSVDLFVRAPMDFDRLWQASVVEHLEGTPIRLASIDHMIEMKREAGRERDRMDIEALEKIRANAGPDQERD